MKQNHHFGEEPKNSLNMQAGKELGKDNKSQLILKELQTPYKTGNPVLEPTNNEGDFDAYFVDGPYVFYYKSDYCMVYTGWDGKGYRSGMAVSDDLIKWKKQGMIMDWGHPGGFCGKSTALAWILRDNDLQGKGEVRKHVGKFVSTFVGFTQEGCESGVGSIGIAFSDDLRHWEKADKPILRPQDGELWERGNAL